jgi:hypothetical protein
MRRVAVILSVAAMLALAAGSSGAAIWSIMPDNYMNAFGAYPWIPGDDVGASFTLPDGPFATEDGAIWMKKPSGVWPNGSQYQLFDPDAQNWSVRTTVYVNTTTGWQICDNGGFINGINMCSSTGYPGYWARGTNIELPSNVLLLGPDTRPGVSCTQADFYVQAWLDPAQEHDAGLNDPPGSASSAYASYAQAYAASAAGVPGVLVGQTPVFRGDIWDASALPGDSFNTLGMYMPALILQKAVPEPSTIMLAAIGLFGLVAYAWRKRK